MQCLWDFLPILMVEAPLPTDGCVSVHQDTQGAALVGIEIGRRQRFLPPVRYIFGL